MHKRRAMSVAIVAAMVFLEQSRQSAAAAAEPPVLAVHSWVRTEAVVAAARTITEELRLPERVQSAKGIMVPSVVPTIILVAVAEVQVRWVPFPPPPNQGTGEQA